MLFRKYIKECNACTKTLRKVIKEYEQKLFQETKTNLKALYRYVNSNRRIKEQIGKLQTNKNTYTTNSQKTAN